MQNISGDAIFIRHAESMYNQQTQQYVARKQIAYDWFHLSRDREYLAEHKYSFHLRDATITQRGYSECAEAKEKLNYFKPDLILVSPLNRTLLTCSLIFPNATCPVIVEPVLSESVRSSCDFSIELQSKKQLYPHYNFEQVEKEGPFWYINNESEENQRVYRKIIEQNRELKYEQILKKFYEMMLQTWIYETGLNLRERSARVKSMLKEYQKQYKTIAVVTHYNIIRYTLAKEFNEHHEPFHCEIKNCALLPAVIAEL